MTFVKQNVVYVTVDLLISPFNNPVFFFGEMYRCMMFYTDSALKCVSWLINCESKSVTISKGAVNRHV